MSAYTNAVASGIMFKESVELPADLPADDEIGTVRAVLSEHQSFIMTAEAGWRVLQTLEAAPEAPQNAAIQASNADTVLAEFTRIQNEMLLGNLGINHTLNVIDSIRPAGVSREEFLREILDAPGVRDALHRPPYSQPTIIGRGTGARFDFSFSGPPPPSVYVDGLLQREFDDYVIAEGTLIRFRYAPGPGAAVGICGVPPPRAGYSMGHARAQALEELDRVLDGDSLPAPPAPAKTPEPPDLRPGKRKLQR